MIIYEPIQELILPSTFHRPLCLLQTSSVSALSHTYFSHSYLLTQLNEPYLSTYQQLQRLIGANMDAYRDSFMISHRQQQF